MKILDGVERIFIKVVGVVEEDYLKQYSADAHTAWQDTQALSAPGAEGKMNKGIDGESENEGYVLKQNSANADTGSKESQAHFSPGAESGIEHGNEDQVEDGVRVIGD